MSFAVIIPDEAKMTIPKFEDLVKGLQKFIKANSKENTKDIERAKNRVSEISGYLIAAEKKKFPQYFKSFFDLNVLDVFNSLLDLDIPDVSFCILEALNFLLLNLKNEQLKLKIYSTKYKTKILGQEMNIIDKLSGLNLEGKDEFLNIQINFMKSLSLKFDTSNIFYFFDKDVNQFQMLTKSFSMYNNSDPMVRNVVKNILLSIMKIKNEDLNNFLVAFPINIYYTNLVLNFKNYILQLCLIDLSEIYNDELFGIFRRKHDELIDISMYLGDILDLGIKPINFMLINCLLNEIILPLFKVIISRNKETANISIALYIFTIIIFNMKNKDITSIISYLLFEENVPQALLKYIYDYSFKFMSLDYMSKINYIIENCQLADVNDKQWKDISVYMKFVNGIDLSTKEVHEKNTFDTIKSVIKNKNAPNLIKNEIYQLTKAILTSNNEFNIIIYNLLIETVIDYYTNKVNLKPDEEKPFYDPLLLPYFTKDESSLENQEGLLQILLKLIQSENNFRISTYEVILYNIQSLINIFLSKFVKKVENEVVENKLDQIPTQENKVEEQNNVEVIKKEENNNDEIKVEENKTEENIEEIKIDENKIEENIVEPINNEENKNEDIKIEENKTEENKVEEMKNEEKKVESNTNKTKELNELSELKSKIKQILILALNFQITKIKNLFTTNKYLWKSSYESMKKAYDQYVKAMDKKLNDLITLPSVLIPINFTIYYDEVAKYLIKNLFPAQILTSNFLVLMVLHDTLYKLENKDRDMIKSKMFPIQSTFKKFSLGKNLTKEDLDDNYAFCKIIDEEENQNNSLIVLTGDALYLVDILSKDFKDISAVKINKKIYLRDLEIKVSLKDEEILELSDGSYEKTNRKYFIIHCLNADNTGRMFNYLTKQKKKCLEMEYSMVNSYLDDIEYKFNYNQNNEKIKN